MSPDLQEDSWPQVAKSSFRAEKILLLKVKGGLEAWVTAGSSALYTATEGWAYICNVKVGIALSLSSNMIVENISLRPDFNFISCII